MHNIFSGKNIFGGSGLFLFITLLFFSVQSFAQTSRLIHYNTLNGLPSNYIYEMAIDSLGYMWIGTENGLVRFDGLTFKSYNSSKLKDNEIIRLRTMENGTIGFSNLSRQLGFIVDDSIWIMTRWDTLKAGIKDFQTDHWGNFWIGHQQGNWRENLLKVPDWYNNQTDEDPKPSQGIITLEEVNLNGLCWNKELNKMLVVCKGEVFLSGVEEKLQGNRSWNFYRRPSYIPELSNVDTVVSMENLALIRVMADGMGFFLVPGKKKFILGIQNSQPSFYHLPTKVEGISRFFDLVRDRDGQLWLGTNDGCYPIELEGDSIRIIGEPFLPGQNIGSLKVDKEGNLWIGTAKDGIYILPRFGFRTWFFKNLEGIFNFVQNLSPLNRNEIVGVSHTGGVFAMGETRFDWTHQLPKAAYRGAIKNEDGHLFVYANQNKLQELYPDGRVETYVIDLRGIEIPLVNVKCCQKVGENIWVGSHLGSYVLDTQKKVANLMAKGRTVSIFDDKLEGRVWMGTVLGLKVSENGSIGKNFKDKFGRGLSYTVYAIGQTQDGTLYFGTHGQGLWQLKNKTLTRIDEAWEIEGSVFKGLEVDGKFVWALTEKGLSKIDTQKGTSFKVEFGISQSMEEILGMALTDSLVWFSTSLGISFFPKEFPLSQKESPRIFLESFEARNSQGSTLSSKNLPHGYNQIEVKFSAISFAERLRYQYKRNTDSYWTDLNAPSISFRDVRSGSHEYQVRALRGNGIVSQEPLLIKFFIVPPLWRQT